MGLKQRTSLFVLTVICLATSVAHAFNYSDNFDSYASLSAVSANWSVPAGVTLDATGGVNGSKAIKFVYNGSAYQPFTKSYGTGPGIYAQFKVKFAVASSGCKFFKIFGQNNGHYANWTWNLDNPSSNMTPLCFGNGSGLDNDTDTCIFPDGNVNGAGAGHLTLTNVRGSNFHPTLGQWYTIDTYNRYSTNGNADGEMWIKVDGSYLFRVTNVVNRNNTDPAIIDYVSFGDYSFGGPITYWLDDVKISDAPISTGSSTSLTPPSNLIVK